mmetsp:Transcript_49729/g.120643  ORF Transcript_49729/g.120643 Transcript_49729/m.120643 type:complete len:251 (+) Transcript_49729:1977-2729(+)
MQPPDNVCHQPGSQRASMRRLSQAERARGGVRRPEPGRWRWMQQHVHCRGQLGVLRQGGVVFYVRKRNRRQQPPHRRGRGQGDLQDVGVRVRDRGAGEPGKLRAGCCRAADDQDWHASRRGGKRLCPHRMLRLISVHRHQWGRLCRVYAQIGGGSPHRAPRARGQEAHSERCRRLDAHCPPVGPQPLDPRGDSRRRRVPVGGGDLALSHVGHTPHHVIQLRPRAQGYSPRAPRRDAWGRVGRGAAAAALG